MFASSTLLKFVSLAIASSVALAAPSQVKGNVRYAPASIPSAFQQGGAAPASHPLEFSIHLAPADSAGLDAKMKEIALSKGALPWLTQAELKQFVGPTKESTDAIESFFKAQGIDASNITYSALGNTVTVKSTVEKVASAFSADFDSYKFKGSSIAPKTKQYTIPSVISDHVLDISGFSNFLEVKRVDSRIESISEAELDTFQSDIAKRQSSDGCTTAGVTPQCLRNLYGTASYTPSSSDPEIGVMGYIGQSVSQSDLTTFLTKYRSDAADYQIPIKTSRGASNDESNPGTEAMLDVETVVAQVYPIPATFYDLGTADTEDDIFSLTFQDFINADTRPAVITISYGGDENQMTSDQANSMCNYAQQLTSLGTTIVVSSGDYGVAGQKGDTCDDTFIPTYPSGCPYILSVGALQGFNPEVAVGKDIAGFYGGAGFSNIFSTPDYQSSAVSSYESTIGDLNSGKYNAQGKAIPDVSADGSKYVTYFSGGYHLVGGTSASAPTFASVLANLNSARKAAGQGTVGWIHPTIYGSPDSFTDITSGGSYGCSDNAGFPAKKGYDPSTGLGSPVFGNLRTLFGA